MAPEVWTAYPVGAFVAFEPHGISGRTVTKLSLTSPTAPGLVAVFCATCRGWQCLTRCLPPLTAVKSSPGWPVVTCPHTKSHYSQNSLCSASVHLTDVIYLFIYLQIEGRPSTSKKIMTRFISHSLYCSVLKPDPQYLRGVPAYFRKRSLDFTF